jgi:hypothetical protein
MTSSISEPRNLQVESMLRKWGLTFELDPEFPLGRVQIVEGQQVRDISNLAPRAIVQEYLIQHNAGAEFPPIVLRRTPGQSIGVMVDGNTRLAMAREAGLRTFPAYLVEFPNSDIARAVAAQLNQMSGVRLTGTEAKRAASEMMQSGTTFTDANIAMVTGTSPQQVRLWRLELQAEQHAERVGIGELFDQVRPAQRKTLGKVQLDEPYKALVEWAASGVPNQELAKVVREVNASTSEHDAMEAIRDASSELRPVGPTRDAVTVNSKARRARMVLPQVVNLAPPLDLYDVTRAESDRALWIQVRRYAETVIAMYDEQAGAAASQAVGA